MGSNSLIWIISITVWRNISVGSVGQPGCGWPTMTKSFIFTTPRSRRHASHSTLFSRPVCVSVTTLLNRGQSNKQKDNNKKWCAVHMSYIVLWSYIPYRIHLATLSNRGQSPVAATFFMPVSSVCMHPAQLHTHTHARTHESTHARRHTQFISSRFSSERDLNLRILL